MKHIPFNIFSKEMNFNLHLPPILASLQYINKLATGSLRKLISAKLTSIFHEILEYPKIIWQNRGRFDGGGSYSVKAQYSVKQKLQNIQTHAEPRRIGGFAAQNMEEWCSEKYSTGFTLESDFEYCSSALIFMENLLQFFRKNPEMSEKFYGISDNHRLILMENGNLETYCQCRIEYEIEFGFKVNSLDFLNIFLEYSILDVSFHFIIAV